MTPRIFWAAMLLLSSCSAPRYTYFFSQPPATASEIKHVAAIERMPLPSPLQFSASRTPTVSPSVRMPVTVAVPFDAPTVMATTIAEEKTDNARSTKAKGGMDADLKRSMAFAAGGIVALLIGGHVFWVLGSLSLLIGFIFGIKWLLRK